MKNITSKKNLVLTRLLSTVPILVPSVLEAQETEQPNWYQVEVIIFTQTLGQTDAQESWPKDIVLAYPPGSTYLTTKQQITNQLIENQQADDSSQELDASEEKEGASEQDGFNSSHSAVSPTVETSSNLTQVSIETNNISPASSELNDFNVNSLQENISPTTVTILEGEALEAAVDEQLRSLPFTRLPADTMSLTSLANALERNRNYRVLSHLSWRQPELVLGEEKTVIVTGGDLFDQHYELEGTLTLKVSRYLHLESNLWLTQFYPNYGEASGYTEWPPLPEHPASQAVKNDAAPSTQIGLPLPEDNNTQTNVTSTDTREVFGEALPTSSTASDSSFLQLEQNSSFNFNFEEDVPALTTTTPGYIIDRVILNNQSRKMRSGETHYLDHPILGLIVKVTRWEIKQSDNQEVANQQNIPTGQL